MDMNELEQLKHDMLPAPTHDELARQQFARSFKEHIVAKIHPGNRVAYDKRVKPAIAKETGKDPVDRTDVEPFMVKDPHYQMWSSMLRTSQEIMWSAAQKPVERNLDSLVEQAKKNGSAKGSLTLDENVKIPRYHTAVDIHCQPGGYHTEVTKDDVAPGAVYDRAVFIYAMGQMGPDNADMGRSIIEWLKEKRPGFAPQRILDMGCSVGHSTVPYKAEWPEAEVHAIDVAGPMLRYAHARAESLGQAIHYSQQNAESTNFEDNSFDLIVSHILLHETSQKAIKNIMAECHRLLKPGGMMIHAETPPYAGMDAFDAFMLDWDTFNNNEPFWRRSHELDLKQLAEDAGFDRDKEFEELAPSAFQVAKAKRSHKFQGGDFGGGGFWFLYGAEK
ncbi:MAG: methyltransferase domain-containing protein [Gammaproteobacteria bacterium]